MPNPDEIAETNQQLSLTHNQYYVVQIQISPPRKEICRFCDQAGSMGWYRTGDEALYPVTWISPLRQIRL